MSSRPIAWRISYRARGGWTGKWSSSLAASKRPWHHLAQPRGPALVGHVAALLGQAGEDVVEVAQQLDLGHEVLVDLGRDRVDADDLLVATRSSSARVSARPGRSRWRAPRRPRRSRPWSSRPTGGPLSPGPSALSGGIRPLPMNVSATGMPVARTNSRSAGVAPPRTTPLPASATGLSAPRTMSAALSSSRACGSASGVRRRGSGAASICASITSSGSSMCVAPGFSPSATLNALRTTSGMMLASDRRAFHLVIGRMTRSRSMYWCDSLCIRSRSPCPVSATSGARSR